MGVWVMTRPQPKLGMPGGNGSISQEPAVDQGRARVLGRPPIIIICPSSAMAQRVMATGSDYLDLGELQINVSLEEKSYFDDVRNMNKQQSQTTHQALLCSL